MLRDLNVVLVGFRDLPVPVAEVDETGATFAENARVKASAYAMQTGFPTIADDSGLEVSALGGRPGVHSARFGGKAAPFARKIAMLLEELGKLETADRSARFVCSLALAEPSGKIVFEAEGICSGQIAFASAGSGGFGYDPVFIPDGFNATFGELPAAVKARVGHRGRALAQIVPFLRRFYAIPT